MSDNPPATNPDQSFSIKQMLQRAPAQLGRALPWLVLAYGSAVLILGLVLMIGNRTEGKMALGNFLRDPAQVADLPFYTGLVSNLGVFIWSACMGISLFAAVVLKRINPSDIEMRRFFLLGGLLTAVLVLDDLFMIHEEVVPRYLFSKKGPLHVKEGVIYILYAAFAITFLWRCRFTILHRTDSALFLLAVTFLGLSIAADKVGLKGIVTDKMMRYFVEDGFKFLGIVGWTLYFIRSAIQALSAMQPSPKTLN